MGQPMQRCELYLLGWVWATAVIFKSSFYLQGSWKLQNKTQPQQIFLSSLWLPMQDATMYQKFAFKDAKERDLNTEKQINDTILEQIFKAAIKGSLPIRKLLEIY